MSPLKLFVIDELPSVAATGNLTAKTTPQIVSLPVAVDGAVGGQSSHYFRFSVLAGQTVSFEVLARRIGSSLDPVIRILDLYNRELASNDDAPGQSGDSQLSYTFPLSGEYLLELRDIRYQGGAYRLRMGDFPCAATAYPLAVQRGTQTPVIVAGKFVDAIVPTIISAPTEPGIHWIYAAVKRNGGLSSGFAPVAVVDNRQFLEQEPNNTPSEANRIEFGMDVNGRFEQPGDVDRFVFSGKKDQSFVFTGFTRQQGSPADLSFKVLGPDGAQVAAAEDAGTSEGSLTAKFPADGDYTLVVEELNRRGGPDEAYRIEMASACYAVSAASTSNTLNIPQAACCRWSSPRRALVITARSSFQSQIFRMGCRAANR
ncbi:MAG: PPC domain-containing protein [Planctomycetaceae bacterium]